MAYKNLVYQSCADLAEAFQRLRDFICARAGTYDYSTTGIGWTLHDAVYATDEDNISDGDYVVLKSLGEAAVEPQYIKVAYINSTSIRLTGYLSWDASTHSGVLQYAGVYNSLQPTATAITVSVYGDLDIVAIIASDTVPNQYLGFFGRLKDADLVYDGTIAATTSAVSSGSDVTLSFSALPSSWEVGTSLVIRDGASIERAEIKTISSTDITVDLSNGYASGAFCSEEMVFVCSNYYDYDSSSRHEVLVDHSGATSVYFTVENPSAAIYTPADALGKQPLAKQAIYSPNSAYGFLSGFFRCSSTVADGSSFTEDGVTLRAFVVKTSTYPVLVQEV